MLKKRSSSSNGYTCYEQDVKASPSGMPLATLSAQVAQGCHPGTIYLEMGCQHVWIDADDAKDFAESILAIHKAAHTKKRGSVRASSGIEVAKFVAKVGESYTLTVE